MNPSSRFYDEPFGLAEYQPARVVFVRPVPLPGVRFPWCRLVIVCAAGHAPTMSICFLDEGQIVVHGAPLSIDQWQALRESVNECWAQIQISCTCGHAFGLHEANAPHGCGYVASVDDWRANKFRAPARGCPCSRFAAAEPLVTETNQLAEKRE